MDLNLESREALEDALRGFPGSLLLVSHDRALLDAVGTRTLPVEDGELRSYEGSWAEYAQAAPCPDRSLKDLTKGAGARPASRGNSGHWHAETRDLARKIEMEPARHPSRKGGDDDLIEALGVESIRDGRERIVIPDAGLDRPSRRLLEEG